MRRLILVLLVLLGGCGYRLLGLAPEGLREICLGPFQGVQGEPGFETKVAEALREELQSKGIEVREGIPLCLRGKVVDVALHTVAYDESARARQYRVSVALEVGLYDGEERRWQALLRAEEVFTVGGGVLLDDRKKDEALESVARELAEEVYLRLAMETWPLEGSQ